MSQNEQCVLAHLICSSIQRGRKSPRRKSEAGNERAANVRPTYLLISMDDLESSFFLDSDFAAIVTAFAAYSVRDVPCATVRAKRQSRSYSLVVSSSLGCSCLRLFTFRMCHFVMLFYLLSNKSLNASHRGSFFTNSLSSASASASSERSRFSMSLLHSPSAWTCLIGMVSAIVS